MTLETIAINSPGEMGQAVGQVLAANGLRVIAALRGRSPRTRALAAGANIEDAGTLNALVREADMVLSILVPDQAENAARDIAQAMKSARAYPLYVDCNAIAAETSERVGSIIEQTGARYVDASIIGPPPRLPGVTRFYASGQQSGAFAALNAHGLDVRVLEGPAGRASSLKTCYAALTKGLSALGGSILVAAEAQGLGQALGDEFRLSQPGLLDWLEKTVPGTPPKAHRFVGEMEEHAKAFAAQGLTPKMMEGAADFYRMMAATPIGKETPEEAPGRSAAEVAAELAKALKSG
jgi:3-hydroxyisobutyrate dehydrogenase-like beta-hydroxyacid dehydrogenase